MESGVEQRVLKDQNRQFDLPPYLSECWGTVYLTVLDAGQLSTLSRD